jgi:hypothetical protein
MLHSVLLSFSKVYVVVDALDELSDQHGTRSQFLTNLRDLQSRANMNLMATSRFNSDIMKDFRHMPLLEIRASDADVREFVAGQTSLMPKCVQQSHDLQIFLQDRIVETVDGMLVSLFLLYMCSSRVGQVFAC